MKKLQRRLSTNIPAEPVATPRFPEISSTPSGNGSILPPMTPQIARLYTHVSPVFWPYLWLQLRWIFKRQDKELRTLLISVTRWGQVHIVQVGDHWRAYRKLEARKASWDDPVWKSAIPPNMVGVFLEESKTLLAGNPSAPTNCILPCLRGLRGTSVCTANAPRRPEGSEGRRVGGGSGNRRHLLVSHPVSSRTRQSRDLGPSHRSVPKPLTPPAHPHRPRPPRVPAATAAKAQNPPQKRLSTGLPGSLALALMHDPASRPAPPVRHPRRCRLPQHRHDGPASHRGL
ncbi:hypothetical protein HNE_1172 [Hyphomonas neptunium ATCC 15444]|uniref:Uncharacterized protein n=1 Tax=Hyphomonas neptunium (strain ATCC 15444) TaxID=228405 RepID=Q0C303_HYPNA|nr:hypothetical protein HNE_1172 [Hyphomonas neptunium ATCC 15444]